MKVPNVREQGSPGQDHLVYREKGFRGNAQSNMSCNAKTAGSLSTRRLSTVESRMRAQVKPIAQGADSVASSITDKQS